MGIMIHKVEIISNMDIHIGNATAAFEVRPIQLIAFTREILQQLEFQVSRYRQLEAGDNSSFAVPKSDFSKPYYYNSGPCLFHLDLLR